MPETPSTKPCPVVLSDPPSIYLAPACLDDFDRVWCEEPQAPCPDCGAEWVKYRLSVGREAGSTPMESLLSARADLAETLRAERDALAAKFNEAMEALEPFADAARSFDRQTAFRVEGP